MNEIAENKELRALIKLMDEPDPAIFSQVHDKILSFGTEAIPTLEETLANTFEILTHKRIENLLHQIQLDQLQFELSNWLLFSSDDLLKGFILLSRYQYPEIREEDLIQTVEQLKWDVWLELNENLTPLETIKVVNHVFFEIHKYGPNRLNPNALQNYFLNNLLETHKGNPLSLGILYLSLCNRLHLPVMGVDLPEHFILAYVNTSMEISPLLQEINFYINPYKKGAVFTRREVDLYLNQIRLEPRQQYYQACDNATVLKRLIQGMIAAYKQFSFPEKVKDLEQLSWSLK